MRYPWILFDADGTLFDYDRAEAAALEEVWTAADLPPTESLLATYREINERLWRRFEAGELGAGEIKDRRFLDLLQRLGIGFDGARLGRDYREALARQTHLLPGSEALLEQLAEHRRMALITNGLADVQRPRLARSTIGHHFAAVVISEEVGAAKPDPRIFAEAFRLMGEPSRREVLVVGDNLTADIGGAHAFGVDSCWFNPEGRSAGDGIRPTHEIRSLDELPGVLMPAGD